MFPIYCQMKKKIKKYIIVKISIAKNMENNWKKQGWLL
jgi:hypothetical protein